VPSMFYGNTATRGTGCSAGEDPEFGQWWASTGIRHELFQSAHNSAQWFRPVPVSHGNALLVPMTMLFK
jgi:hypothetical protein